MIPDLIQTFLTLDLFPMLAAIFAALSCGLLGNFLVLRKQSLMGDAISHAVLPGLVGAFLIFNSRSPGIMFVGAAISALATVVLVELIKRLGKVEPGAAMGVVFSVLFALGVFLLENADARSVDLDADCVLHGNLQTLFWSASPTEWNQFLQPQAISDVPHQLWTLMGTTLAVIAFITIFFKELRIASFDAGIATIQGINAGFMHMMLMTFVAIAAVASFEAVGSILVIAMLICPARHRSPADRSADHSNLGQCDRRITHCDRWLRIGLDVGCQRRGHDGERRRRDPCRRHDHFAIARDHRQIS